MRLTVEKNRTAPRINAQSGCRRRRKPRADQAETSELLEQMVLVRHIARQIYRRVPQHVELDDLVSAGALGLLDAYRRFDRSRHVQFKSFAQFRVRGAILDSLRMADWVPRGLRAKQRDIFAAIGTLTQRLGRAPMENEIASDLGMRLSAYQGMLFELSCLHVDSLDASSGTDSGAEAVDHVAVSNVKDPLVCLLEAERRRTLADAMETLPERDRLVLTLSFYEELTLKEIGAVLGVVESRVSQIRSDAIARLRSELGVLRANEKSPMRGGSYAFAPERRAA